MKSLDLGCGLGKPKGAIGLDIWRGSDADVLADLSGPHLPFRDNVFNRVKLTHVIEHIWGYGSSDGGDRESHGRRCNH